MVVGPSVTMSSPDPAAAHGPTRALLGVALRVGAMACVATLSGLVKWCAAKGVPLFEIVFFRNAFAFIPLVIYMARSTGFSVVKTRRPMAHFTRSAIGLVGMTCGFAAVQHLPLTEASAFQFTSPLFMTALAVPILREPIGAHRWAAVLVGFAGVLIIIRPLPGQLNLIGAALGLGGAVATAFAQITIREIGRTEPGAAIVFYFTVAGTLLGLASLPFGWVLPDPGTLALLVLCGLIGGVAQILLTESLKVAPVGLVAPFDYSQLIWASLFGFLVWGETPHAATALGALIVAASGLYIVVREARRRLPVVEPGNPEPL
jgi:drug/metabolite transporter (DMT)-like permease